MNWISVISQVFFGIVVTSLTGSIMLFIWFLCRQLLHDHNPKMVYYMLRWVVFMYMLPITYVSLLLNYKSGYVQHNENASRMLFVLNTNGLMTPGLATIWLCVTVIIAGFYLKNEIAKWRICRWNFDDGASLAQTEFERIKKVLGVKGNVVLLRNDNPRIQSPFVTGIFKRAVVLPYGDYSEEELKVVLYHELNHVKKSDVLFRYLTVVAIILNSINPVSYILWEQMLTWSEADCDAYAVDGLEKEGISKDRYYDIIYKLMMSGHTATSTFYYPMLMNAEESLNRRKQIMEKYRVNMRRVAKSVTFAGVMVFALLSSTVAYAAGIGTAKVSDAVLKETQNVTQFGEFEDFSGWSDEMLIPASDTVDIIYINDDIMTLGGGTIDWDVPVGTRYVTSSIYFTEGTVVQIACTATPSNCTYWFGLMHANSDCSVVEGSGYGAHGFTIPSTGYYRIMVENRSSQVISVNGGYSY